ncbi:MAG: methylated-DNA--[protein]-cysteine S-methyltransferase [Candidatus Schekmanbacteria bacterium]|nr:methylated-DNA--[protein]-cysteine S-methyltransferase [Candidatus Schekmanbacteria bacterium]
MANIRLKYAYWQSPVGYLFLLVGDKGLCKIIINRPLEDCLVIAKKRYSDNIEADQEALGNIILILTHYFLGRTRSFNLELDWEINKATPFQKKVWQVLAQIPYGQVRSYQWVANKINVPQGTRAVGAANRSNPLPIVIPCHRVINADGGLGGYRAGVQIKQTLLEMEGVRLK